MPWVNFYDCKNASGTTLTDSIGTNNGTLAGASLPTINGNGYLSFNGDNGSTSGNRSRVDLTITDYQYTDSEAFTIIVKYRFTGTRSNVQAIFATRYNAYGGGLPGQSIYNVGTIRHFIYGSGSGTNFKYTNNSYSQDVVYNIITSYNNNTMNVLINGFPIAIVNGGSGVVSGNIYSSYAVLGCERKTSTTAWYDMEGDIFLHGNRDDAMSLGAMKTYNDFLTGAIQC